MRVLKFGGSSVGHADTLKKVVSIIREAVKKDKIVVVVSALGGTTDQLIHIGTKAESGDESYKSLLQKLEEILDDYFVGEKSLSQGVLTVQYLSEKLNMSSSYLSDMLRSLTGQNTQQHIHYKLIEKAKEKLSTTNLSVSEVAYELGFEYPQSFSKLFKTKTNLSPLEFRRSFN